MTDVLFVTEAFRRAYKRLTPPALARLSRDPRHPGLHAKKMQGRDGLWDARARCHLRIPFAWESSMGAS